MSYEHEYSLYAKCPCGKGEVREDLFTNDWSQHRYEHSILCPICAQKYHIESLSSYHKTECIERLYLVPNGQSITFHKYPSNFNEELIYRFTKSELEAILQDIKPLSSSKKISIYKNIDIVKIHKRYYSTVKISEIQQHIAESIQSYDSLEWNYNKISAKQAECDKTERYLLNFQRKD